MCQNVVGHHNRGVHSDLGAKDDLNKLQQTMKHIQHFLNDAEKRRTKDSAIDNWLCMLKDATYKVADIIDLMRLERNKLITGEASSSKCTTTYMISQMLSYILSIQKDHKVAIQNRDLNNEFEKIKKLSEIIFNSS
jgi:hypothetical protein